MEEPLRGEQLDIKEGERKWDESKGWQEAEVIKDQYQRELDERKRLGKENKRIIEERERAKGRGEERIFYVGGAKNEVEQMKQEQDKAAMGYKDVEYRKLLKE